MAKQRSESSSDGGGTQPPVSYRMYFLTGDGRISHAHEFHANGDDHALGLCDGWREGRPAELWSGSRKVRAWERDS